MVHHIVMWKFKPEIPKEDQEALKAAMAENLKSLVGKVPMDSSTHDIALVTTLEKKEDVAVYGAHPEHVKVADTYIRPYVTDRVCLDYE